MGSEVIDTVQFSEVRLGQLFFYWKTVGETPTAEILFQGKDALGQRLYRKKKKS